MYGTKSEILLEKILKNVGVFNTSPYFYAIESNPYSTKTERLLYLIEVHTRVLSKLIPPGGNQGDLLAKASNADFDLEWIENYTSSVKHTVKLGEPINKGQAVYVSSADGTNMIVSKASNSTETTSSKTMGLLAFTGDTNAQGFVVTEGLLAGLDTSSANASDPVWLGTDGNLIFGLANKPAAPAHLVFIGVVTRKQQNNGEIFVKAQNGFELKEIHDVLLDSNGSIADNEVLAYDTASGLWKNQTAAEASLATQSYVDTALSSAGKVKQVVQGTTSTAYANSTTTMTDTGLSATITPTSATSKILVLVSHNSVFKTSGNANNGANVNLLRDSTVISGSYLNSYSAGTGIFNLYSSVQIMYLDSPNTTSATIYKTQMNNVFNGPQIGFGPYTQSIILIEIGA